MKKKYELEEIKHLESKTITVLNLLISSKTITVLNLLISRIDPTKRAEIYWEIKKRFKL